MTQGARLRGTGSECAPKSIWILNISARSTKPIVSLPKGRASISLLVTFPAD
jgi:hypothetical protein